MAGENRLRRVLGPVQLTSLGVGAIIGAGIFVATGAAAHNVAGPALMLSYVARRHDLHLRRAVLRGVRVDGAGRRVGLHLRLRDPRRAVRLDHRLGSILEYAVGAATVANGWSGYFQSVLAKFGLHFPAALAGPPIIYDTAAGTSSRPAGSSTCRRS